MRLAFSIAMHAKGDIFLVDEVLSVGDESFQKRCFNVFKKFKRQGKTIVFASHDLGNIEKFCDRVIFLKNGKLMPKERC